jgi:predicted phosphohydrolase
MQNTVLLIIDDVHLENRPIEMKNQFLDILQTKVETLKKLNKNPIVLCAGDISEGVNGIEWISALNTEVIYICGNHEFWGQDYYENIDNLKKYIINKNYKHIHFLHNETITLQNIRFIGATLWTDLGQSWPWLNTNHIIKNFLSMGDFKRITAKKFYNNSENIKNLEKLLKDNDIEESKIINIIENKLFNPLLQIEEHLKSKEFIFQKLLEYTEEKTVVLTHHLPVSNFWMKKQKMKKDVLSSYNINHKNLYQKYIQKSVSSSDDILMMGFYVNEMNNFFNKNYSPNLWIHGHFHKEINDYLGKTQMISAPVGYLKQSEKMNYKEYDFMKEKEYIIKYILEEIELMNWDELILDNIRNLENYIVSLEKKLGFKMISISEMKIIVDNFEKIYEIQINEIEKKINHLFSLFLQKISFENIINDYFLNAQKIGFAQFFENYEIIYKKRLIEYIYDDKSNIEQYYQQNYKKSVRNLLKAQAEIQQFKKSMIEFFNQMLKS